MPMDKEKKKKIIIIAAIAISLIWIAVSYVQECVLKRCAVDGCDRFRVPFTIYCPEHQGYYDLEFEEDPSKLPPMFEAPTPTPSGKESPKPTDRPKAGAANGNADRYAKPYRHGRSDKYSGSGKSGKKNKSGKKVYNDLDSDPADYDNPEDYADDAWGSDFEDWDDAYDYWEDY